ncbi:hypothetical protein RRG08_001082 [Elysia crispata]|uniref:Uncharacterized protein n=1 Tax=Elysia crispata TaxID=231223 RepID=A0AAE1AW87_9GAST|nr:hypothetical protein RRG08_001082 [Elysia crispata]
MYADTSTRISIANDYRAGTKCSANTKKKPPQAEFRLSSLSRVRHIFAVLRRRFRFRISVGPDNAFTRSSEPLPHACPCLRPVIQVFISPEIVRS